MATKTGKAHNTAFLGELEVTVMDHFWSVGQDEVKEVHAAIGPARGITLNTIQSTVKRLHKKGLLVRRKVSHAYVYTASCSRSDHQRMALRAVVDSVMEGETSAMLAAFVDLTARAGEDELARLEAMIAARRKIAGEDV